jgi:catechol 2,3-dioxygenase
MMESDLMSAAKTSRGQQRTALERPVHIGPRRLCHVNIFVRNLERSLNFYNRTCGLEIVLRQPEIRAGFLSNGNTHHDVGMIEVTREELTGEQGHRILAPGQASKPGLYHLGWEMESEFDLVNAYRRARAAGLKIWRTVRHRASHSLYLFDPDGNIHEFYADVDRDWRRLYREEISLSGQWDPAEGKPSVDRRYHEKPEIRRVDCAALQPIRLSHAVLTVRNYEMMTAFFDNCVGLFENFRSDDAGVATYGAVAGSYAFALALVREDATVGTGKRGLHHFAFEMRDEEDIASGEAALSAAGIPIERSISSATKRSLFVRDPNGLLVEFCKARAAAAPAPPGEDAFQL